jgi:hypothetical protein
MWMSEPTTQISLDELRKAFDLLVSRLVGRDAGDRILLHRDAFWSVPTAYANDVYSEPPELMIGMVSESWSRLQAMIDDETKVVGYGFIWLAEVLRAIGAETV